MITNDKIEEHLKQSFPFYKFEQIASHIKNVHVVKIKGFFKTTKIEKFYDFTSQSKVLVNEVYSDYSDPRKNYRKKIGILTIDLAFNEDEKIIYWKRVSYDQI